MTDADTIVIILICIACFLYGIAACCNKRFRKFMHSKIKLIKETN